MSSLNNTVIVSSTSNTNFFIQLQLTSQYLSIVLGLIILISGIVGNFLNIVIFFILGNYRRNACSFYMLSGSIMDTIFVVVGLITRTLSQGFLIDFTIQNKVWCKLRSYILTTSSLCSFTCICLQSIDAYFVSSRSQIWRQKSNIRTARYLVIGFICLWLCHESPYLYFQDLIVNSNGTLPTCVNTNLIYSQYRAYFLSLGLTVIIPLIIIILFGFLTYRQLQSLDIQERRSLSSLTTQMIQMVLAQIITVFLFQGSYAITQAYFLATTYSIKSATTKAQEQVVNTFFSIYVYNIYAVSNFYVTK
ncbi:unnamed protein product [Adineta steineri]|uniref:G-protein coupled receptors family 1 profile domain-containing protein n=1 Tax=Adineta steineri TaxID=433720 RepID=A0A818KEQ3_9BILA|nr:unnamed protein product [Adineta steineri]CAF1077277.1 unnamed protein product [Adineta steineri]CAF1236070.1 unnamed protein product [Adineta steineri]CAF3558933.1 unnamed protein product [Adineta steineri]CAF3849309.1 unnamed protein product [Adineta steineri]